MGLQRSIRQSNQSRVGSAPTLEGIMGQPCRWANGDAKAALAGGLWAVVLVALNRMVRHPSDPQKLPAALQAGRVPLPLYP